LEEGLDMGANDKQIVQQTEGTEAAYKEKRKKAKYRHRFA
jgi:hypothetical protein